jgi:hypothetical protein
MSEKPRYSVKKYIFLLVVSGTSGLWLCIFLLRLVGFPAQGLLLVALTVFPIALGALLTGFYKGLVKYYGFREPGFQDSRARSGDVD